MVTLKPHQTHYFLINFTFRFMFTYNHYVVPTMKISHNECHTTYVFPTPFNDVKLTRVSKTSAMSQDFPQTASHLPYLCPTPTPECWLSALTSTRLLPSSTCAGTVGLSFPMYDQGSIHDLPQSIE